MPISATPSPPILPRYMPLPFNSSGMYRGQIGEDGVALIGIYDEPLTAQA